MTTHHNCLPFTITNKENDTEYNLFVLFEANFLMFFPLFSVQHFCDGFSLEIFWIWKKNYIVVEEEEKKPQEAGHINKSLSYRLFYSKIWIFIHSSLLFFVCHLEFKWICMKFQHFNDKKSLICWPMAMICMYDLGGKMNTLHSLVFCSSTIIFDIVTWIHELYVLHSAKQNERNSKRERKKSISKWRKSKEHHRWKRVYTVHGILNVNSRSCSFQFCVNCNCDSPLLSLWQQNIMCFWMLLSCVFCPLCFETQWYLISVTTHISNAFKNCKNNRSFTVPLQRCQHSTIDIWWIHKNKWNCELYTEMLWSSFNSVFIFMYIVQPMHRFDISLICIQWKK